MKRTKIVAIVLEMDGKQVVAHPITPEKLSELKSVQKGLEARLQDCSCGEEFCIGGYIYRCAEGPDGSCQLYASDWQCNG